MGTLKRKRACRKPAHKVSAFLYRQDIVEHDSTYSTSASNQGPEKQ